MVGRTSIMAIIGGTFAKLGGGKFANGALSAAFVHLFNDEFKGIKIPELDKESKQALNRIKLMTLNAKQLKIVLGAVAWKYLYDSDVKMFAYNILSQKYPISPTPNLVDFAKAISAIDTIKYNSIVHQIDLEILYHNNDYKQENFWKDIKGAYETNR